MTQTTHLPNCIKCGMIITSRHGYFRARRRGYGFCSQSCAGASKKLKRIRLGLPADSTAERFHKNIRVSENGCHEWIGYADTNGYGRMSAFGRKSGQLAHRVSWELTNGPIPSDMDVLHRCDNPPCCNPEHLWLGTAEDNVRDMIQKGRRVPIPTRRGENINTAKLTPDDVRRIRSSSKSSAELGVKYGISRVQVNNIRTRKQWTHVK